MSKLMIFPYSGNALEALDAIVDTFDEISFISDDMNLIGTKFHEFSITNRSAFADNTNFSLAVHGSVNSYKKRLSLITEIERSYDVKWTTVIHPSATISKFAHIGKNVFISAGVVVGANVVIEDHVIILANSTIHHDSIIKSGSIICGNVLIAGGVVIGNEVYIGAGVAVKNSVKIASSSLVGIGSVVLKNIAENETWFGNPAKMLVQ